MQFKDIIGQHHVKEQLVNMVRHNRLSHALLFLGKEGSGALSLALAFTQYIVCTSAKETQNSAPGLFGEVLSPPDREPRVTPTVCVPSIVPERHPLGILGNISLDFISTKAVGKPGRSIMMSISRLLFVCRYEN